MRDEVREAMDKATLDAPNGVFVLPPVPCPPLPAPPSAEAVAGFRDRVFALTCLAGLAGLPQVSRLCGVHQHCRLRHGGSTTMRT